MNIVIMKYLLLMEICPGPTDPPKGKSLEASASISSSTHSVHSLGSAQGDVSMDGRVARWARGFDKLIEDPAGLKCFKVNIVSN